MTSTRKLLTYGGALAISLSLLPGHSGPLQAQSSDIQVLVAPLEVEAGLDRNFGKKVAEEVRKLLEDFAGLQPIDWDDVKDKLDQFELKAENMTAIEWRQLAAQMNANMVMAGRASSAGGGVSVNVSFVDPGTQDELPVPPFTVQDDDEHKEAAARIIAELESGVEYTRSVAFCSDYLNSDQLDDALRNCEAALELNPGSTRAQYLIGRVYMEQERWDEAIVALDRVIELQPSNTEALQSAGYAHAQAGNSERSLELYTEYLTFNPDDATVRLSIAFQLASAGLAPQAMAILREGVERDPDNADLLQYLGSVALSAGTDGGEVTDPEAVRVSVDAFEQVLEIRGEEIDPAILSNVITAYTMLGDLEEALAFSERAIAIIESPPASSGTTTAVNGSEGEGEQPAMSREQLLASIYTARSNVYQRMEDYARAASELERALELNPELQGATRRIAILRLRGGDTRGAISAFREAVSDGSDPNEIANALFAQGYNDYFKVNQYGPAIDLFEVAAEFAQAPDVSQQIHFFIAYGHFQMGTNIDKANEASGLSCQPARQALAHFQRVLDPLGRAGNYEANSQAQIRDAVSGQYGQIQRQNSIIRAECR